MRRTLADLYDSESVLWRLNQDYRPIVLRVIVICEVKHRVQCPVWVITADEQVRILKRIPDTGYAVTGRQKREIAILVGNRGRRTDWILMRVHVQRPDCAISMSDRKAD